MEQHNKLFVTIRYFLIGRKFHNALSALEFASKFHDGTRKDKVTPEYHHQLQIAHYIRTLENHLDQPEESLAASFLHDVAEDYDVGFAEIENRFGRSVADAVTLLTKKHRKTIKNPDSYFGDMADNKIASVVKGADRINNIQTMVEVFSLEKQKRYIEETETQILPMLKLARRNFPTQEPVYENIKMILKSQITLIRAIHRATSHDIVLEKAAEIPHSHR